MQFKNLKSGFTLLEILLVVAIISVLAGIVIIAVNPSKQLATVRNTERKSDIKQLNSALNQYYIDQGSYPNTILSTLTEICDTDTLPGPQNTVTCNNLIDLSILVPTYITSIPTDPQGPIALNPIINTAYAATNGTGYYVMKETSNKIIVASERAELETVIAIGTTTSPFITEDPDPETCTSFTYTDWTPEPCEDGIQTRTVATSSPEGCTGGTPIITQSCDVPLVSYTLTYDANGGSGAPTSLDIEEGSTITLSATEPNRDHYFFDSWNTQSDGTGTTYYTEGSFTMGTKNVTLYAVWNPIPVIFFTLFYDANGGSGEPEEESFLMGNATISSTTPIRTGYTFSSWNTQSDGSGTTYSPDQVLSMSNDIILYAIWKMDIITALRVGLVGYWPLDETSGNLAYDNSVSGYNGTIVGATINQTGKVGQAVSFDGNGTITTSWTGISGANSRTVSVWFKVTESSLVRTFVSWGDLTAFGRLFEFFVIDGQAYCHPYGNPVIGSPVGVLDDNSWHHAVWAYSSNGSHSLYVDGILVATMSRVLDTYTTKFVGIGYRTADNSDYFNGLLDEVAIWNRALSAEEVSDLYNSGSGRSLVQ